MYIIPLGSCVTVVFAGWLVTDKFEEWEDEKDFDPEKEADFIL